MFRIECFVEDKHLATVMHALAGVAQDLKVLPVAGTRPNPELRKPKAQPSVAAFKAQGGVANMIVKEMKARKLAVLDAEMARDIVQHIGLSPRSYSYHLAQARKAGVLAKVGGNGSQNVRWKLVGDK